MSSVSTAADIADDLTSEPVRKREDSHRISDMFEIESFTNDELRERRILTRDKSSKNLLNTFRGMRTTLYKQANGSNYVCVVTSVLSGGGSSYIVNNLAAAIALDESKSALIIDCNIYAPSAQDLLTTDYEFGLTDYLSNEQMSTGDIIYASGIPRVRVVPVGGNLENGAELFSHNRMYQFLQETRYRYSNRFIIIEAPPAAEFAAEMQILSDMADLVLLVVPFGKVTAQQVTAAAEAIAPQKLVGTIFNN